MSQGMPTDPFKAAQVMNLGDAGYSAAVVARMLNIPDRTAADIIGRHGRWGEVADRPVFAELRRQQKVHLEAASRSLAAKCLMQAEAGLEKMSSYQAVGMYGILRQHERLDAGEPTQITEVVNTGNLELLAAKLSEAVQLRTQAKAEEIDITPGADAEKLGK